jgi:hypothetical protein
MLCEAQRQNEDLGNDGWALEVVTVHSHQRTFGLTHGAVSLV